MKNTMYFNASVKKILHLWRYMNLCISPFYNHFMDVGNMKTLITLSVYLRDYNYFLGFICPWKSNLIKLVQSMTWRWTLQHPISHPHLVKTSVEKKNCLQLLMDMNFRMFFQSTSSCWASFPYTTSQCRLTLKVLRINRSDKGPARWVLQIS